MCIFYLEELASPWTFRQLPSFTLISYPVQIKRVSGCCSTPNDQFFSHITVKRVIFPKMMVMSTFFTSPICQVGFYSATTMKQ
jgi:hypothetical protein